MLTIRAMSDGKGYSSRHLEHSDYYAEGERVVGRWQGRGARLLGLDGEVKPEAFEALRQGLSPETREFLRQRQSADRIAPDGSIQSRGRNLYDFTVSAPKSVSVMAILGGDTRLMEAHERATAQMLQELATHAASRVRKSGANENRHSGNLVLAVYHHDTSRELDPQLHTHAVAANLTYDGTEGRWKALQASGIYERRAYLTEVYRNALAREVRLLGYEIDSRKDRKGRDQGFEIRGIGEELLEKYSRRSRQRDEAIERFKEQRGRKPTDNEVAVLVRESRADKLMEISTEEVRLRQRARLTLEENLCLTDLRIGAVTRSIALEPAVSSLQYAKDHIFERVSVARDHDVLTEALRRGRGRVGMDELKGALALQEAAGEVIRNGYEIATQASLKREREMIDCINRGIGTCDRMGRQSRYTPSDRLNPEQQKAVRFVLDSKDMAVSISGAAGTGKTATLEDVRRRLTSAGRKVIAVAPTTSAVEELARVGFTGAMTLERLLQDERAQKGLQQKVLIVDEAGMVSGRQMMALLELAERESARIVFSGDTRQIRSVEACDALRILESESQLKTASLEQVRRQVDQGYREAIQELRRDPTSGFEKLDAIGAIRQVPWPDRAEAIAKAFAEEQQRGRTALVVCATHEEIDRITEAIRSQRKQEGGLAEGTRVDQDVALNWTAAQKSDMKNFRPGQVLGFHRAIGGFARHESVRVVEVDKENLTVRTDRGEKRTVTARHAKSFDVYERSSTEVAAGDRLLITANRRKTGFQATNGEVATVEKVDKTGRIWLADGRVLPANFRHFAFGYAVTAHRSQGKTVDSVIISGDGMQKELFYVAASRGRKSILVVTSDKELLSESVGRSSARRSASELARIMPTREKEPIPAPTPVTALEQRPPLTPIPVRSLSAVREVENRHSEDREYDHGMER